MVKWRYGRAGGGDSSNCTVAWLNRAQSYRRTRPPYCQHISYLFANYSSVFFLIDYVNQILVHANRRHKYVGEVPQESVSTRRRRLGAILHESLLVTIRIVAIDLRTMPQRVAGSTPDDRWDITLTTHAATPWRFAGAYPRNRAKVRGSPIG